VVDRRTSIPIDGGLQRWKFDHPPQLFHPGEKQSSIPHPRAVLTICVGKSTYARCGIIVNVDPPSSRNGEGFVTLEISNTAPLPAKIYANEGIAQVLVFPGLKRSARSLMP